MTASRVALSDSSRPTKSDMTVRLTLTPAFISSFSDDDSEVVSRVTRNGISTATNLWRPSEAEKVKIQVES